MHILDKKLFKKKEIDLRFIDSIKFMSSSLDSLVNNLASSNYRFFGFEEYNEKQCALLIRKGIYPFEIFGIYIPIHG